MSILESMGALNDANQKYMRQASQDLLASRVNDARADALDEAYDTLLHCKGDKATLFDACTAIRKLKERTT